MIPASRLNDPADLAIRGARLLAVDGRPLPLAGAALSADAKGGVARAVLEQRFRNRHAEPLAVTYSRPLPADSAVSGFAFRIGERRVVGEIDRTAKARERYEQALAAGEARRDIDSAIEPSPRSSDERSGQGPRAPRRSGRRRSPPP